MYNCIRIAIGLIIYNIDSRIIGKQFRYASLTNIVCHTCAKVKSWPKMVKYIDFKCVVDHAHDLKFGDLFCWRFNLNMHAS